MIDPSGVAVTEGSSSHDEVASRIRGAARAYLDHGYAVVPVKYRAKRAFLRDWTSLRISHKDIDMCFAKRTNIGIILGEASGGLIDIDLDCDEAIELAPLFLTSTSATTGRASKPRSHWWYRSKGAPSAQFKDPLSGRMIAELRSDGHQTVVGPSVHESGENIDVLCGEPTSVSAADLRFMLEALGCAVLIRRYPAGLPAQTTRRPATKSLDNRSATPGIPTCEPSVVARASAYISRMPPAISGQGGHNATYAVATTLVHGFGLELSIALQLMRDEYNPRCEPPWGEHELIHKVKDAATKPHQRPFGWLRDQTFERAKSQSSFSTATEAASNTLSDSRLPGLRPDEFPADLLEVPGLVGEFVKYDIATSFREQPVLALAGGISLQATLAGRKIRDEFGNRTNLYIVSVAGTGAGKDHARQVLKSILHGSGLNNLLGNEDIASDAGLIAAVKESPSAVFLLDEFGKFLATVGNPQKSPHLYGVVTTMLRLFSCAGTVFRGKAYADTSKTPVIVQPCMNLLATSVPESLFASLTHESISDGFLARQLMFEGKEDPLRKSCKSQDIPKSILETASYWGAMRPGSGFDLDSPEQLVIVRDRDAEDVFSDFGRVCELRERARDFGFQLWSRAEEKACRLALVYACSANPHNPKIDAPAATWAVRLVTHLTERLIHLASRWVSHGYFDAQQNRVYRVIEDAGGTVSRSELSRRTQWLKGKERNEIIDNLIETGRITSNEIPTDTKPITVLCISAGSGNFNSSEGVRGRG